jgi:hypothetical protein
MIPDDPGLKRLQSLIPIPVAEKKFNLVPTSRFGFLFPKKSRFRPNSGL